MRAAIFEQAGEPVHVLTVQDVPAPEPGPDEVVVGSTLRWSSPPTQCSFAAGTGSSPTSRR